MNRRDVDLESVCLLLLAAETLNLTQAAIRANIITGAFGVTEGLINDELDLPIVLDAGLTSALKRNRLSTINLTAVAGRDQLVGKGLALNRRLLCAGLEAFSSGRYRLRPSVALAVAR